jgi:hypothetical protein
MSATRLTNNVRTERKFSAQPPLGAETIEKPRGESPAYFQANSLIFISIFGVQDSKRALRPNLERSMHISRNVEKRTPVAGGNVRLTF